ncbi:MAG: response regulator [Acidobacteriota bacterium]
MPEETLRVLLIEDDEDDYILVRALLAEIYQPQEYVLIWADSYESALEKIQRESFDVYLLDYRLGEYNGLDLLQKINGNGCKYPVILLTGQGDYEVDLKAMRAGAADYLVKGQINGPLLERSIRYAIERNRTERQLKYLASKLLTVQEEEKTRLAQQLHDKISQTLVAVKFGIEGALQCAGQGTQQMANMLQPVIPVVQGAIAEVRILYMSLRPTVLDDLGIFAALNWLWGEFKESYPDLAIEKTIEVEESDIPEELKIVIYRVIQEAMSDVVNQGRSDRISTAIRKREGAIELVIEEHAAGSADDGLRLASIKERVDISGGSFTYGPSGERSMAIVTTWPV